MLEWFKKIEWFDNYYINEAWLVYRESVQCGGITKQKFLKPYANKLRWWYNYILLCEWDKRKNLLLHRLVAIHFLEKIEWKDEINHKDWNKSNNHLENLEWCTRSENNFHKYRVLKVIPSERQKAVISMLYSKPVLQYTLSWEFIREWKSATEAKKNWYWKAIDHCLRWLQKQSHWFIWKYKKQV